jgi:hypothetical protein
VVLSTIDVVLVTEDADGHAWTWDLGELDSSGETLVTLGVIVLQADLQLNGFAMPGQYLQIAKDYSRL